MYIILELCVVSILGVKRRCDDEGGMKATLTSEGMIFHIRRITFHFGYISNVKSIHVVCPFLFKTRIAVDVISVFFDISVFSTNVISLFCKKKFKSEQLALQENM